MFINISYSYIYIYSQLDFHNFPNKRQNYIMNAVLEKNLFNRFGWKKKAKIQFSFCVCFWLFVLLFLHYVQDHNPIPDWNQFNKDPAVKRAHHSLYPIMQIKPKLAHSNYIFNTHSFIKNNIHELAGYVHFSFFLSFLSELYKNIFSFSSQLFAVF